MGTEQKGRWRSHGGLSIGEWGGKVQRISSIDDRWKIDGEGKNRVGNVEAKELISMTHGHEL